MSKVKDIFEDFVYYTYDVPKTWYKEARCYYYTDAKNPWHWKLVWFSLFHARPWDCDYKFKLDYLYLNKMKYYFEHNNILISENRELLVYKYLDLAISLLEIITEKRELWDWDFENKKYVCKVNVNTRNVKRFWQIGHDFTNNNKIIRCWEYYLKDNQHELYQEKALRLYLRILQNYSKIWWD